MSLIPLADRWLHSRRWWRRIAALQSFGLLQVAERAPQLVAALDDDNGDVRSAALDALADLHDPTTLPAGMQRLADELAAAGLVEFIDNPTHRRSKLVQPTRKGAARYRAMTARFLGMASTVGAELNETEIRKTAAVVRQLSADIAARWSSEGV